MFMYEIAKNKFILIDKFEFISQVHNHAERKIAVNVNSSILVVIHGII